MAKTIELPRQLREAATVSNSFDAERYTVDVVWTTGAAVRRRSWMDGDYVEELIVNSKTVRLDRLNSGAPFLNTHNSYDLADVIGSVVPGTAKVAGGRGVATVQLSRTAGDADIITKIKDGIIRNISVGYAIHKVEKTESDDGSLPVWRVVDWEPMELSAVPIPADPGAMMREADRKFRCLIETPFSALAQSARMRMRMRERMISGG